MPFIGYLGSTPIFSLDKLSHYKPEDPFVLVSQGFDNCLHCGTSIRVLHAQTSPIPLAGCLCGCVGSKGARGCEDAAATAHGTHSDQLALLTPLTMRNGEEEARESRDGGGGGIIFAEPANGAKRRRKTSETSSSSIFHPIFGVRHSDFGPCS